MDLLNESRIIYQIQQKLVIQTLNYKENYVNNLSSLNEGSQYKNAIETFRNSIHEMTSTSISNCEMS